MSFLRGKCLNRLRSFFRKEPLDRELNEEFASHLEFAVEENIAQGMTPKRRGGRR